MKGGQESSGATPMDQRFYDPDMAILDYPSNSGNGIMSAYGPIESGDVGVGMLAPYTSSKCSTANVNTMMKTGGKKKEQKKVEKEKGKKMKGSGGPIPKISSGMVTSVVKTVDKAIDGFTSFMEKLDSDYNKSVQEAQSIKIGNQRLIQGGKKSVPKKLPKKLPKKSKIKKGGSTGSDFALTLNSRGPSNAPDDYWGVPGETWFRQFNKTGDYIPNSQLAYAATPTLAGENPSGIVSGYDMADLNYRDF